MPGSLSLLYLVVQANQRSLTKRWLASRTFLFDESPDPFGAGALIPINKHRAEKKGLAM